MTVSSWIYELLLGASWQRMGQRWREEGFAVVNEAWLRKKRVITHNAFQTSLASWLLR